MKAIRGCRDFEELRKKLESVLPEAKEPYPTGLY
jgi:hypothetical protein